MALQNLQLGNLQQGFGSIGGRRVRLVIYGEGPPDPEVANAQSIAATRTKLLSIGRALPPSSPYIKWFSKVADLIILGGPPANEYAFTFNDLVDPRWDITINKERTEGQTWTEYVAAGGFTITGIVYKGQKIPLPAAPNDKFGLICAGTQQVTRARPLNITVIQGNHFEDTCTVVKAFLEGQGAGIFNCTWTPAVGPPYTACPVDCKYTKRP